MNFAIASYSAAALAFALLALVLLAGWRARPLATRLFVAVAATVVWAAIVAVASARDSVPFFWIFGAEIARDACWLTLLTAMARDFAPRWLLSGAHLLWIGLLCAGVFLRLVGHGYLGGDGTLWLSRSGLALAFAAFVLIEQIYRNATSFIAEVVALLRHRRRQPLCL